MKIRIDAIKYTSKKHQGKIQTYQDTVKMTIYRHEGEVGTVAYNFVTNEASHQYVWSEAQFNVYTVESTVIQTIVELLRVPGLPHIHTLTSWYKPN